VPVVLFVAEAAVSLVLEFRRLTEKDNDDADDDDVVVAVLDTQVVVDWTADAPTMDNRENGKSFLR